MIYLNHLAAIPRWKDRSLIFKKSIAFLYTSNDLLEFKIITIVAFILAQKKEIHLLQVLFIREIKVVV